MCNLAIPTYSIFCFHATLGQLAFRYACALYERSAMDLLEAEVEVVGQFMFFATSLKGYSSLVPIPFLG